MSPGEFATAAENHANDPMQTDAEKLSKNVGVRILRFNKQAAENEGKTTLLHYLTIEMLEKVDVGKALTVLDELDTRIHDVMIGDGSTYFDSNALVRERLGTGKPTKGRQGHATFDCRMSEVGSWGRHAPTTMPGKQSGSSLFQGS